MQLFLRRSYRFWTRYLNNTRYETKNPLIPPPLITRFSIHTISSSRAYYLTASRAIEKCDHRERNSSDSMADPRASVKTVPRERLEGKTPRDAFALVGNIIAEFQASFRACYQHDQWISPSLSFSLMTLAATLVVDQVTNRIYRVECSFHDR